MKRNQHTSHFSGEKFQEKWGNNEKFVFRFQNSTIYNLHVKQFVSLEDKNLDLT